MRQHSVLLPPIDLSDPGLSAAGIYRHALSRALDEGVEPAEIDPALCKRSVIQLYPAQIAKLDDQAKKRGLPFNLLFAMYVVAGSRLLAKPNDPPAGEAPRITNADTPFPAHSAEQIKFFKILRDGLKSRPDAIVMAEGSTGIGKGVAICAAAIEQVVQGQTPVVICAPTVNLVGDLYRQFGHIPPASRRGVTVGILPGATEFIDDRALRAFLAEQKIAGTPENPAVLAWTDAGGRQSLDVDQSRSPLSQMMAEHGIEPRWLASDLRAVAPTFPVDTFLLAHAKDASEPDAEDSGRATLQACRALARVSSEDGGTDRMADIVICTHAMVAIAQKTRWNAMAKPKSLLIDEAHLFEQAVANVQVGQMPLISLKSTLDGTINRFQRKGEKDKIPAAKAAAKIATETLRRFQTEVFDKLVRSDMQVALTDRQGQPTSEAEEIKADITRLEKALAHKELAGVGVLTSYLGILSRTALALGIKKPKNEDKTPLRERVLLSYSPVRHYPSITVGVTSVRYQLEDIWEDTSVALISATLYTRDAHGNQKCDYMSSVLALDPTRLQTPLPVVAPWITETPSLHLPTMTRALTLIPPKQTEAKIAEWQKWMEHVSETVAEIAGTAAGGTLVLATSYDQIEHMQGYLSTMLDPARIIPASGNRRFAETEAQYREAASTGIKPIMLAAGGAWAGVSLIDITASPEQDRMLTDLVIVRLPLNLNRTMTMHSRVDRRGMTPIVQEALLMWKQGLGRLVRRPGLKDRRIWILDGRLMTNGFHIPLLAASALRMLDAYTRRETF